jgi:hypothetical protein
VETIIEKRGVSPRRTRSVYTLFCRFVVIVDARFSAIVSREGTEHERRLR